MYGPPNQGGLMELAKEHRTCGGLRQGGSTPNIHKKLPLLGSMKGQFLILISLIKLFGRVDAVSYQHFKQFSTMFPTIMCGN